MLETIREYALERLEHDDDVDDARRRHAEHYAAFAERAYEQLDGPAQLTALDRLEAEHDNLRAALAWSLGTTAAGTAGQDDRAVIGLRLVQALTTFWYQHGHATEGTAVAAAGGGAGLRGRRGAAGPGGARARGTAGPVGRAGRPLRLFERSLAIWRELGDRDRQARELNSLGIAHAISATWTARAVDAGGSHRDRPGDRQTSGWAPRWPTWASWKVPRATSTAPPRCCGRRWAVDEQQGDMFGVAVDQHSLALVSLRAGRPREARGVLCGMIDYVASCGNTALLREPPWNWPPRSPSDWASGLRAARLAGAAEAIRRGVGQADTAAGGRNAGASTWLRRAPPSRRRSGRPSWPQAARSPREAIALLG